MKVLIAPDKFKGSLTALQVCNAIHETLSNVDPTLDLVDMPLADGGEGTCELLTTFSKGTLIHLEVRDPLSRKISTVYGLSKDRKIAFLEMAKASGLQLLKDDEKNPLITSTVGTGDMIRHALDQGVEKIFIGIGGSATTDGGMGMADALGIYFYDRDGRRLQGIGESMQHVHLIDTSYIHPRLANVEFTVFCDVDNALFGLNGAAYIFSPQKGADSTAVAQLDEGLKCFARVLEARTSINVNFSGAGAGGGLPAALKAFATVDIQPGMAFITQFIGLEEYIKSADVIITGEGKIDAQTMSGKVVKGVADLAGKYGKALLVVAGKSELPDEIIHTLSIGKIVTLTNNNTPEVSAMANAYQLLGDRIREAWPDINNWGAGSNARN